MRAEVANLNHCAVPFLIGDQNLVRPGTVDNRGRTIFNNFTLQWPIL